MRFSAGTAANAAAWGVIVLLIGVALLMASRLGFMGLLLLGSATWLVCTVLCSTRHHRNIDAALPWP